jgi:hypothetical protein
MPIRDSSLRSGADVSGGALQSTVESSLSRLRAWLERSAYAGIEPHDALTSPLMTRTPLGRSRFLRLAALQGLRRLPLNVRPLLGIRPQVNSISLGWALKAYALLNDGDVAHRIDEALDGLRRTQVPGYSGACWGYYFDWQTRTDFKPANLPIVVSTAFIGSGLLDIYERFGRKECLDWARSACDFILKDLNRAYHGESFCFSYSPDDHEQVYNASILGAALLARVGAITAEPALTDTAGHAVDFVVRQQAADGSWGYAYGDHRTFIDNFHTGYVLDSLQAYIEYSGDRRHAEALARGYRFYRTSFFVDDEIPKYYHDRLFPIDAHALAQSVVTLLNFGDRETAERVGVWGIRQMQAPEGYFIYQRNRRFTCRIPYLRWSNAWMLYALARLADHAPDPIR